MQEEIDYLVNERVTKLVREIHSQENSKFEKLQQKFQNCSVSKVILIPLLSLDNGYTTLI